MTRRKLERRVQEVLGLNQPTRRYCITRLKFVQNYAEQRISSKILIFSLEFTGEPAQAQGTRVTIAVDIDIIVQNTEAIRVIRTALSMFSEWSIKPNEK